MLRVSEKKREAGEEESPERPPRRVCLGSLAIAGGHADRQWGSPKKRHAAPSLPDAPLLSGRCFSSVFFPFFLLLFLFFP